MTYPISFEFFPPKTPEGAQKLRGVRQELYSRKPQFCSVTYGAGGSTQEGTFGVVKAILEEGVDAASHFSCVGATKASVREQLQQLKDMGVKRLVALRGDLPSGYGLGGEFHYASDLVAFIRAEFGSYFHIEVLLTRRCTRRRATRKRTCRLLSSRSKRGRIRPSRSTFSMPMRFADFKKIYKNAALMCLSSQVLCRSPDRRS